jgi:hypothetical protein
MFRSNVKHKIFCLSKIFFKNFSQFKKIETPEQPPRPTHKVSTKPLEKMPENSEFTHNSEENFQKKRRRKTLLPEHDTLRKIGLVLSNQNQMTFYHDSTKSDKHITIKTSNNNIDTLLIKQILLQTSMRKLTAAKIHTIIILVSIL